MHSSLEPEKMEEDSQQGSNLLKRKFSEIDGDQNLSPMVTDSNGYELNVYEVAKNRNIIAVLGTGIDKSEITKMLIKAMGSSDTDKRLIIFLAPTQCCEIRALVNLKVEEYFGAKGVDKWTSQRWDEEVSKHDNVVIHLTSSLLYFESWMFTELVKSPFQFVTFGVLVMTPQILLDALRSAFLKLEMVCLLIVDECHHTTGNHPYAKLMKEFYHESTNKPKIFGLTASAVVRKGMLLKNFLFPLYAKPKILLPVTTF
ncbi:putative ribonuclease III [Arabidopsis thaliana]